MRSTIENQADPRALVEAARWAVLTAVVTLVAGACGSATTPDQGGSDTDADVTVDLGLPATAERADVAVAWTLESSAGTQGVQTAATLALSNGDIFVGATFADEVVLGDVHIVATPQTYRHQLAVRVRPDGTLRFARWLCDGCLGPAAEAADGRIAMVSVGTRLVGNPNTDEVIDASAAVQSCGITVLSPDGVIEAMARFGSCAGTLRAVAPTADGGWLVGGHVATGAVFDDGTVLTVTEGVAYPGQAFVAKLRADLGVAWVERVGGTAASSVSMLAPWGDGFVAVGDYGGYPPGATAEVGDPPTVLVAEAPDDDPAMDLFVARWRGPGDLAFARRVLHYGQDREPTWLRTDENCVDFRIDNVGDLVIESGEPHYGYGGPDSARLRFDVAGVFLGGEPVPARAIPWPGADAWSTAWSSGPSTPIGAPPDELVFERPASTQEVEHLGWVLGQWRADGGLGRAGHLVASHPAGQFTVYLRAAVPQADGSWLIYLNGAADLTLSPDEGEPTTLPNTGYERMIFLRAWLAKG